jgi:hypothetical protein
MKGSPKRARKRKEKKKNVREYGSKSQGFKWKGYMLVQRKSLLLLHTIH